MSDVEKEKLLPDFSEGKGIDQKGMERPQFCCTFDYK